MITESQIPNSTSLSTDPLFEARVCSSNNILSQHDEAILHKMLADANKDISVLEEDITKQEEVLSRLEEHHILKIE